MLRETVTVVCHAEPGPNAAADASSARPATAPASRTVATQSAQAAGGDYRENPKQPDLKSKFQTLNPLGDYELSFCSAGL